MEAVAEQRDESGVRERRRLLQSDGGGEEIEALWREADDLAVRRETAAPARVETPATPRPAPAPRARFHLD